MSHNTLTVSRDSTRSQDRTSVLDLSLQSLTIGGGSNDYSNSGATGWSAGDVIEVYGLIDNGISGASVTSSGGWVSSVTVPSGTYRITALVAASFSASGSLRYSLHDGSSSFAPVVGLGEAEPCQTTGGGILVAVVVPTSDTTYSLRVVSSSNVSAVASQGTTPSQSFLIVEALL